MASHMIRSTTSIHPSIHPSIHWLSLGRPNHCLPFQFLQKASKFLPKILPKSIQNPLKIIPKPSQNRPRTLPEPSFKAACIKNSNFSVFFQFLEGPGPPKIEPKSLKIAKKYEKSEVKKTHVFQHHFFSIFLRFGLRKRSQNRGFFDTFSKTSIL